jgi:hypothetical protein
VGGHVLAPLKHDAVIALHEPKSAAAACIRRVGALLRTLLGRGLLLRGRGFLGRRRGVFEFGLARHVN